MKNNLFRGVKYFSAAAVVTLTLPTGSVLDALMQSAPREKMVVNAEWLKKHIGDHDLVLLQVGEKPEYDKEHIPGARFITMDDLADPRSRGMNATINSLELPTPEAARAKLESLGISDRSMIVVYPGKDWWSPSTRIIFTLDWIGLGDRTVFLDGGMPAWKLAGGEVTAALPTIQPGKLSVKPTKNLVVDADWVNSHRSTPGYALIDARSPDMYDGTHPSKVKSGHIPGAHNIPFDQVINDSGVLKPASEIAAMFEQAGVKKGDTVVGYCHLGMQATAMLFAARTLGYNVVLYDGSFHDWEKRDLPVEGAKAK